MNFDRVASRIAGAGSKMARAGASAASTAGSVAMDSFRSAKTVGKAIADAPPLLKMGMVGAGLVGGGLAARAFTHDDSYQAEDHAVSDGMGSYEVESGVRERMNRMGGGGDLVFGLHARRH